MLLYIILCIALLYTIVAYYLCLTSEMPGPPDWKKEEVVSK
jgi:hypothetical protein